jgi:uncharacterized membrane protein YdfJ with MMPL/SSD domain
MFILVVGAATDYALLLVARYKEELHEHESPWQAMKVAWRATVEPILASAATVILGLLCLLLADLGSTRGLGPVGAIGIVGALLASLTLLPALLVLGLWFVFQFFSGTFALGSTGGGVAWWAHVGGFVFGMIAITMLRRQARRSEAWIED